MRGCHLPHRWSTSATSTVRRLPGAQFPFAKRAHRGGGVASARVTGELPGMNVGEVPVDNLGKVCLDVTGGVLLSHPSHQLDEDGAQLVTPRAHDDGRHIPAVIDAVIVAQGLPPLSRNDAHLIGGGGP